MMVLNVFSWLMSTSALTGHKTAMVLEQLKEELMKDLLLKQVLMTNMIFLGQDVF